MRDLCAEAARSPKEEKRDLCAEATAFLRREVYLRVYMPPYFSGYTSGCVYASLLYYRGFGRKELKQVRNREKREEKERK